MTAELPPEIKRNIIYSVQLRKHLEVCSRRYRDVLFTMTEAGLSRDQAQEWARIFLPVFVEPKPRFWQRKRCQKQTTQEILIRLSAIAPDLFQDLI